MHNRWANLGAPSKHSWCNRGNSVMIPLGELYPMVNSQPSNNLDTRHQYTKDSQEAFLGLMACYGTIGKACQESGVNRESVRRWRNDDVLGFHDRFLQAQASYGDYLEDMVHDRLENPTGNRGSDVLLMARLNAEKPEKWSRSLKLTHDVPNELIQQLRALQALSETPKPEPKAIEGETREIMPWE